MTARKWMRIFAACIGIPVMGACIGMEETSTGEVIGSTVEGVRGAIPGWASQTGYGQASTPVQKSIVAAAKAAADQSSGPSFVVAPIGNTTPWQTDIADGDGARMRSAYKRYANWRVNPGGRMLDEVRSAMIGDFSDSAYKEPTKGLLVDHIIDIAGRPGHDGPFLPPPKSDRETLEWLGIRKQCLEWAVTTALQGGGKAKGYSASAVTDLAAVRPGMGLYKTNHSHAMIIVDIEWDASGKPVNYKVAESNWGSGWTNPAGMIPWKRTVRVGRVVSARDPVYVVDYED